MAKNALEERESIEQNRPELSQLILRRVHHFQIRKLAISSLRMIKIQWFKSVKILV